MGDEKETWKVKTLDEILQEKKRRRELEEKTDAKRLKNTDDRESKRDTPEEGELRDHRMEITIRNSPYVREDSIEDRGEEDESLAIKPPQQMARKDKSYHRKEEKRKEKRRHRSHSAEGGRPQPPQPSASSPGPKATPSLWPHNSKRSFPPKQGNTAGRKTRRRSGRTKGGSVSGRRTTRLAATTSDRNDATRPGPTPAERGDAHSPSLHCYTSETAVKCATLLREGFNASGSASEEDDEEEEESSSQSEGNEEGESGSESEGSEQSAGQWILVTNRPKYIVPESRFDHDSEESGDEEEGEEDEEGVDATPQSHSQSATPEDNYIPDSPPVSPVELKKELPKYLPALQGCRSVEEFQCLNRIEEGTYGVVYRAKDKKTDEIVALKRLKMEKEKEGFPITSLREINTILKAQHPNIVTVREIVVGSNMDKIYIVMNYVEHDLKSLMETMKQPFLPGEVKTLMVQLLRGVRHLHDNWILHRDLKTSNLLLSHKGILKIGDFGLAREYGSPLKPYTPVVVTLWYRGPELLLGAKEYSTAVDMWSVGCIFGELLTQKPLFPGKSEIDQINKIFKDLGSPSEKIWPGYVELPAVKKMTFTDYPYNNLRKRFGALLSDQGFDLMNKFLTYCPAKRISADEALMHEYFQETPRPIEPSMFPTWPAKSEQQRVKRGTSPRPPEGGLGYSQLGDDDLKDTGFHLTTANQGLSKSGPGFSLKF
uniref:cyclin-dependent kinase n=1 Tax=Electrophorus electricus TaxID=8005 RepID=A0A4W4DVV7_ELEEL